MRICHLLSHGSVGGTERFVLSLTDGLIQRGHELSVVNTWTGSALDQLAMSGATPYSNLNAGTYRIGPVWLWKVGDHFRRNRYDIVQTYGLRSSLALRMIQGRVGVRHHVFGVRGLDQQRTGWQAFLDRRSENRLAAVVCNARAVADRRRETVGTPDSLLHVIPNGLDLNAFPADGESPPRSSLGLPDGFLYVMVANFREEKDHGTLLEAFHRVSEVIPDSNLILIGGGKLRDQTMHVARLLNVSKRVVFTSAVADVRPYLRATDAFVLSSYSEGMPRALMEAMAMGLPVVATNAGGIGEVAEHEKSALLVAVRNPAALVEAMIRVARDADLRRSLGRSAAERIRKHFSVGAMIDAHERLYESIVSRADQSL